MDNSKFFSRVINFFREDLSEVIGAYFDGEKIFIVHMTDTLEAVTVDADSSEIEHLAERISLVCLQRGWKTQSAGFCLQDGNAVTYQTVTDNVPEKDIPALVKSWANAQTGVDATFAFMRQDNNVWMETLPRKTVDEFSAAWKKFGMNLRGLSVMPVDMLTKIDALARAEFIARVVRERTAPNLLSTRGAWNLKKISLTAAAIVLIALAIGSAQLLADYDTASDELDAANRSLAKLRDDLALKKNLDADIAELHRLNKLGAAQDVSPKKFNLLINLGKVAGGGVSLTKIRAEENFLELEGISVTPDAVKSYLSRVKSNVAQSARIESSTEQDDGYIAFVIRATI